MKHVRRLLLLGGISFSVLLFAASDGALAQNRRTDAEPGKDLPTLQALLDEMRLLRRAVQQSNLYNYRTQLLLQRLRIQQEHVDRVSRQLDAAKSELADLSEARLQFTERIKEAEEKINLEPDEENRAQGRRQLKELQLELQQLKEREQARMERESQLVMELQSGQSKLTELTTRLEALEREVINLDESNKVTTPKRRQ